MLATGTPILDRGLHFARLEPQRSYVLALDGAGPMEGMYLSAGSDARSVRDAPGGTLVVGGAGHVVGRTVSHLAHLERLRGWAAKWYPATTETHHWSAQDYSSPDGVPYVGPLRRGGDRIHVATGYEKWGMTNAVVAARAISSDILGDMPSWAQTLSGRPPSASNAAEIARINLGVGAASSPGPCAPPRAAARQRRTGAGQPVRHRRRLHPPRRPAASGTTPRRRGTARCTAPASRPTARCSRVPRPGRSSSARAPPSEVVLAVGAHQVGLELVLGRELDAGAADQVERVGGPLDGRDGLVEGGYDVRARVLETDPGQP